MFCEPVSLVPVNSPSVYLARLVSMVHLSCCWLCNTMSELKRIALPLLGTRC